MNKLSDDPELIASIKNALAVTLSVTIQQLGPAPNELGDGIKKILAGNDICALPALGCYLYEAREKNDWNVIGKLFDEIAKEKARNDQSGN